MENHYSYAEFLKAVGKNSSSIQAEKLLNEIYMDLFLKHIHREQIKEQLMAHIDHALDCRDERAFMEYSERLLKQKENNE